MNDRINEIDSLSHIIGLASNNLTNHSIFLNRKEFERLPTTMVSLLYVDLLMDISHSTLSYFILGCSFLGGKNQESKKINIIYENI